MQTLLPLDKMTTEEKLRAMEEIWADLDRNVEDIPSPAWHEAVLRERAEKVRTGKTKFISLEELKHRLRNRRR